MFAAGAGAGTLGALLGIGGGVFLVPFLNLTLGFPIKSAAAISLSTVIATSSSVSAGRAGRQVINLRLGMMLEVATVAGSLLGGLTAQFSLDRGWDCSWRRRASARRLKLLMAGVLIIVAALMLVQGG